MCYNDDVFLGTAVLAGRSRRFLDLSEKRVRSKQLAKINLFKETVVLHTQFSCPDIYIRSKEHVLNGMF